MRPLAASAEQETFRPINLNFRFWSIV